MPEFFPSSLLFCCVYEMIVKILIFAYDWDMDRCISGVFFFLPCMCM